MYIVLSYYVQKIQACNIITVNNDKRCTFSSVKYLIFTSFTETFHFGYESAHDGSQVSKQTCN